MVLRAYAVDLAECAGAKLGEAEATLEAFMPRSAEQTQLLVLDAAYELFYRKGFGRVSVDEIAACAGFTKRTRSTIISGATSSWRRCSNGTTNWLRAYT
jgi:hypothetical protein